MRAAMFLKIKKAILGKFIMRVALLSHTKKLYRFDSILVRKKLSEYQYTFLGIDFNSLHQIDLQKKIQFSFIGF